ncbi:MAG: hypothetical protein J1F36_04670 [Clostridiales bacterium]|nr:hypothetical protein [Clostridiales bacterium]
MEKKYIDSRKIVDAIAIFLVLAILVGVAITNATSNRVPTKVYNYGGFGRGYTLELIDSLDELKVVCNAHDVSAFNPSDNRYDSNFNKMIREYDDKFFEKKSLIIYTLGTTGTGWMYSFEGVYKEDDVLLVDAFAFGGSSLMQVASGAGFFIEVKKSDIKGVTRVEAMPRD